MAKNLNLITTLSEELSMRAMMVVSYSKEKYFVSIKMAIQLLFPVMEDTGVTIQ